MKYKSATIYTMKECEKFARPFAVYPCEYGVIYAIQSQDYTVSSCDQMGFISDKIWIFIDIYYQS
jgi:hypothetical protein